MHALEDFTVDQYMTFQSLNAGIEWVTLQLFNEGVDRLYNGPMAYLHWATHQYSLNAGIHLL